MFHPATREFDRRRDQEEEAILHSGGRSGGGLGDGIRGVGPRCESGQPSPQGLDPRVGQLNGKGYIKKTPADHGRIEDILAKTTEGHLSHTHAYNNTHHCHPEGNGRREGKCIDQARYKNGGCDGLFAPESEKGLGADTEKECDCNKGQGAPTENINGGNNDRYERIAHPHHGLLYEEGFLWNVPRK